VQGPNSLDFQSGVSADQGGRQANLSFEFPMSEKISDSGIQSWIGLKWISTFAVIVVVGGFMLNSYFSAESLLYRTIGFADFLVAQQLGWPFRRLKQRFFLCVSMLEQKFVKLSGLSFSGNYSDHDDVARGFVLVVALLLWLLDWGQMRLFLGS